MAILDQKERIIDLVLTDKGRELLSQDELDFTYYSFSDDGINYSGSLTVISDITAVPSGTTLDNYLHRNIAFECSQMKNKSKEEPNDLNYFLFTISSNSKTLPEIKTNLSENITLYRTYQVENIEEVSFEGEIRDKEVEIIFIGDDPVLTEEIIEARFLNEQMSNAHFLEKKSIK